MSDQWYYSKDRTDRKGPVSTDELKAMLANGELAPADLIWKEGLPDWAPLSSHTELTGEAPPVGPAPVPTAGESAAVPAGLIGWLQFNGIMSIIIGALSCLSCFGIITGVLMIVGGTALLGARGALESLTVVPLTILPLLEKLKTFFLVTGISYIIMLVGFLIVIVVYAGLFAAAMGGMLSGLTTM